MCAWPWLSTAKPLLASSTSSSPVMSSSATRSQPLAAPIHFVGTKNVAGRRSSRSTGTAWSSAARYPSSNVIATRGALREPAGSNSASRSTTWRCSARNAIWAAKRSGRTNAFQCGALRGTAPIAW